MDNAAKERLRARLAPSLEIPDASQGRPTLLYGAGQAAHVFVALNPMGFDGVVVSDGHPIPDENRFGVPIVHLSQVGEVWSDPFFVIASMYASDIAATLADRGLSEGQDFTRPLMVAPGRTLLYFEDRQGLEQTIEWMNESVIYVKLRWFEEPYVAGDDWDVLTDLDGLEAILARGGFSREASEWCLDLKWSEPLGFIDESLSFPVRIGAEILEGRVWDPRGFWRVSDRQYPAVFAYHVVFQKGVVTNVPFASAVHHDLRRNAQTKFQDELERLFPDADVSLQFLLAYLDASGFLPPLSEARRAVQAQGRDDLIELLAARCEEIVLGGFLVREAAPDDAERVLARLAAAQGWQHLASLQLSARERERFRRDVRGGVWIETPASAAAGGPRSLAVFASDRRSGPESCAGFEELQIRELKVAAREALGGATGLNWVHGSDDSFETIEWLFHLEEEQLAPLLNALNLPSRDALWDQSLPHLRMGPHAMSEFSRAGREDD